MNEIAAMPSDRGATRAGLDKGPGPCRDGSLDSGDAGQRRQIVSKLKFVIAANLVAPVLVRARPRMGKDRVCQVSFDRQVCDGESGEGPIRLIVGQHLQALPAAGFWFREEEGLEFAPELAVHIAHEYIPSPQANFVRGVINGENWGIRMSG